LEYILKNLNRKFLILFNPASGKKKANLILEKVKRRFLKEGFETEILLTSIENSFTEKARTVLDNSFTDLLAIGGDGTMNLAVNILRNKNVILNIIPSGTGNDFVKNINLGRTLEEQIETIILGKIIDIDAGVCNNQLFLNGLGVGFDGQIVYDNLNRKSILKGHVKYYAQVLRVLATFKPQPIRYSIDGRDYEDDIILFATSNGTTFGGGFRLTPNAIITDGILDICVIRQIVPLRRFWEVLKLSKGTHESLGAVTFLKGKEIIINGGPNIKAHLDGEYFGAPPYKIEALPKCLSVKVKE